MIVIGDVCGHGVEAAANEALVRDAIRAFAFQGLSPERVLLRAYKSLHGQGRGVEMTTVLFALIDPASGELRFSSAGHPPPLLRKASGEVVELTPQFGPPLGVYGDASYQVTEARLEAGAGVLLYTDGVTEARNGADFFGEDRLTAALVSEGGVLEGLSERILFSVLAFSNQRLRDHLALLAVGLRT